MTLTYIYHSGFIIETAQFSILIDFYKDSNNIVHEHFLKKQGKLYVLSTHSHADHFNPEILKWKEERNDITYIFSKEVRDANKALANDAIYLDKLEKYTDQYISVTAFGSTDIGGSFIIEADNKTIFHAGDLNNWHWNEEASTSDIKEAEAYFSSELTILSDEIKHINLAMFPVDPRLGKDYMKGTEQFVNSIKIDIFVPMHFDEAYEKANAFEEIAHRAGCKYIGWTHTGETISI